MDLLLKLLPPRINLTPLINHGLTPQSWDWWSSPGVRPPPSPRGRQGPSSPQWQPFLLPRPLSGSLSQGHQTWPLTSLPGTLIKKTYILFTFSLLIFYHSTNILFFLKSEFISLNSFKRFKRILRQTSPGDRYPVHVLANFLLYPCICNIKKLRYIK